jgi:hypothetical protein
MQGLKRHKNGLLVVRQQHCHPACPMRCSLCLLITIGVLLQGHGYPMIDDLPSLLRPASVQGLKCLALLLIVVDEECFDLIQQAGPKIVQILNVRMCV